MRRYLAIAALLTVAACGPASGTSAAPAGARSPKAATATPSTSGIVRATDTYPGAPQVDWPYLGNGVYGNALLVSSADTWYWDGSVWHHTNTHMPQFPHTPPVLDPLLGKSILLTNGDTGEPVNTWAWSGSGWSDLSASPPGETGPSLLGFDAAAQQLIAVINSTWRYHGASWQPAGGQDSPQSRFGTRLAYDPLTRQLLLFGGLSYQSRRAMADTWTWDGQNWTLRQPATNPPAGWASLAYDPDTRQLLLLDEEMQDETSGPRNTSMWTWDGADWHPIHPTALPPLGLKTSMAYDLANHQLIFFEATFQSAPNVEGSQTWLYTNGSWERVG
jgi:hypothetical protein